MENKFAELEIETAINNYQLKHPEEDNPIVIITSKKNVFGRMESNIIVGNKNEWRGILENIRKKRETFVSVEMTNRIRTVADRILGNMYA